MARLYASERTGVGPEIYGRIPRTDLAMNYMLAAALPGAPGWLRYYLNMNLLSYALGDVPTPSVGWQLVPPTGEDLQYDDGGVQVVSITYQPFAEQDLLGANRRSLPAAPGLASFLAGLPRALAFPFASSIGVRLGPSGGWFRAAEVPSGSTTIPYAFHGGIDFRLPDNSTAFEVRAAASGVVIGYSQSATSGAGVHLLHDFGGVMVRTVYQHLDPGSVPVAAKTPGTGIGAGATLGFTATVDTVPGLDVPSHLHFLTAVSIPSLDVVGPTGVVTLPGPFFFCVDPFGVYEVNTGMRYAWGGPEAQFDGASWVGGADYGYMWTPAQPTPAPSSVAEALAAGGLAL